MEEKSNRRKAIDSVRNPLILIVIVIGAVVMLLAVAAVTGHKVDVSGNLGPISVNVHPVNAAGPENNNVNSQQQVVPPTLAQAYSSYSDPECSIYDSPYSVSSSFTMEVNVPYFDTVYRSGHQIMLSYDKSWVHIGNDLQNVWEDEGDTYIGSFDIGSWDVVHTFNNVGMGGFAICRESSGVVHGAVIEIYL